MSFVRRLIVAAAGLACTIPCPGASRPCNDELISLVEHALATHPNAEAARAEVAAAQSELGAARWARFPGVSVESFADHRRGGSTSTAVSIEQPLWSGGRISAAIRQSSGRLEAALASLDEISLDLAQRTVQAYVDVQRQQRRTGVLDASVAEHLKLVDSMRRRVEQEISPASELQLARSRTRQTEIEALQAQAEAEVALLRLRALTGDAGVRAVAVFDYQESQLDVSPAELLKAALAYAPAVRRVTAEATVAGAEVSIRRSELLPQLGARYQHYIGSDRNDLDDQVGLVVRFQADGGLSRISSIQAALQRERAATLAIEAANREQQEAVVAVLTDNAAARRRAVAGREAALAAESVTESFLRQFAAGRRTWPEVLNSVRETVSAELARIDAEASATTSHIRLLLLSGQWRPGQLQAPEDRQ